MYGDEATITVTIVCRRCDRAPVRCYLLQLLFTTSSFLLISMDWQLIPRLSLYSLAQVQDLWKLHDFVVRVIYLIPLTIQQLYFANPTGKRSSSHNDKRRTFRSKGPARR